MEGQEPTVALGEQAPAGEGEASCGEGGEESVAVANLSEEQQQILRLGFHQEVLNQALSRLGAGGGAYDRLQAQGMPLP